MNVLATKPISRSRKMSFECWFSSTCAYVSASRSGLRNLNLNLFGSFRPLPKILKSNFRSKFLVALILGSRNLDPGSKMRLKLNSKFLALFEFCKKSERYFSKHLFEHFSPTVARFGSGLKNAGKIELQMFGTFKNIFSTSPIVFSEVPGQSGTV